MTDIPMYHDGSRRLQDRFETRRLADRLVEKVHGDPTDADRAFIESRPMSSPPPTRRVARTARKGGRPGLVRVVDAETLAFPSYDGNGMFRASAISSSIRRSACSSSISRAPGASG